MVLLYKNAEEEIKDLDIHLAKETENIIKPGLQLNKDTHEKYVLTFRSSFNTGIKINDTVYCECFVSKTANAPMSLLLHGLGSRQASLRNYNCLVDSLQKNGLSCIFLNLPFHLNRTPPGEKSGERILYFDDIDTLEFYHQSVADIRRSLDIADKYFKFPEKTICGFSMGSMIAAIALAVEKRFSKGILILSGGNWNEIHWNSFLSHLLKGNCLKREGDVISKEKCKNIYKKYPDFLSEFKKRKDISNLDLQLSSDSSLKEKTAKMCFLCDTLTFAHMIDPEKVIMINSKFDQFFTKKSTLQLWNAMGNPQIHWLNRLHTGKLLCSSKVQKIIIDFIKGHK